MTNYLGLKSHPGEVVEIACHVCGQFEAFKKARLLDMYGDGHMPSLKQQLISCRRATGPCGAYYLALDRAPPHRDKSHV